VGSPRIALTERGTRAALAVAMRFLFLACAGLAVACGSHDFDAPDGSASPFSDGGAPSFGDAGQAACGSKPPTTVSGSVFDPAGLRPLYNVIVYVPAAPLAPLPSGVSCDQCGTVASGSPIVSTLTASDGTFVLKNVPAGANVPLVLQIGKWRRQITIPNVTACADTPMKDPSVMRLPRNQSEGDIPRIAVATGFADAFECLLRKIGIDDAEFTVNGGSGRVNVFKGSDLGGITRAPEVAGGASATTLWSDLSLMKQYDLIINACEGEEFPDEKPAQALQNFVDYAGAGGRSFNTHYQYYWIADGVPPMPSTATFDLGATVEPPATTVGTIDTTFPKGEAFAEWLVNVSASTTKGQLSITSPRYDAQSVNAPSLQWITGTGPANAPALYHYTFNTPLSAPESQQCGKVLFSDFHVEIGSKPSASPVMFPAECPSSLAMTSNDLALEFMLFDLSSCIQNDSSPPTPPVN
jgi:hypothetical protein